MLQSICKAFRTAWTCRSQGGWCQYATCASKIPQCRANQGQPPSPLSFPYSQGNLKYILFYLRDGSWEGPASHKMPRNVQSLRFVNILYIKSSQNHQNWNDIASSVETTSQNCWRRWRKCKKLSMWVPGQGVRAPDELPWNVKRKSRWKLLALMVRMKCVGWAWGC